MNWFKLAANSAAEFDYTEEHKALWSQMLRREQDRVSIHFDQENNEAVETKRMDLGIKTNPGVGKPENVSVVAQLCYAGGDWESPVAYFRCQFAEEKDREQKFIFIPSLKEGNTNLTKGKKGGYCAKDSGSGRSKDIDAKKCWDALKEYAKDLYKKMEKDPEWAWDEKCPAARSILNRNWSVKK